MYSPCSSELFQSGNILVGRINMNGRICDGGKYIFGSKSIGLPILLSNIPETIEVEGQILFMKTTFHVTLVAIEKIIEKYGVTVPGFLEEVTGDFCEFVREHEVRFTGFREEWRFAFQGEKRSLVVMCSVSNLNTFFERLNAKYDLHVEYPPTHVTLHTFQRDRGIFLTDQDDIENMTKQVENPGIMLKWREE